jgi:hypothetical protein
MPGLDDYGALLRSGSASVTDYGAQEAQRQLLALKREELQAEAVERLTEKSPSRTTFSMILPRS